MLKNGGVQTAGSLRIESLKEAARVCGGPGTYRYRIHFEAFGDGPPNSGLPRNLLILLWR